MNLISRLLRWLVRHGDERHVSEDWLGAQARAEMADSTPVYPRWRTPKEIRALQRADARRERSGLRMVGR